MPTRLKIGRPHRAKGHSVSSWLGGTTVWLFGIAVLAPSELAAQAVRPAPSVATEQKSESAAPAVRITPTIAIEETLTNNVSLAESASARSDLVSQLTPGLNIDAKGARTKLTGAVSVPVFLYARTGAEFDRVYPNVNLVGNVEALDKFFFVDGVVNVSQQYVTPFGSRPASLSTVTANRYTAQSYTVSPYFKGVTQGNVNYELRDTDTWTRSYGASISTNDAYTNTVLVRVGKDPAPWGWSTGFDRSSVKFADQAALVTQVGRVRLTRQTDPQLQIFGGGGYEDNHYIFADFRDVTYNVGARWRPTDRTTVSGDWEHRFFGSSYHFNFDHRTPLSVWSVSASRDVTSFPQQLAGLPAGVDITSFLNQLFLTSIPDPVQRAALIAQIIQNGGLPLFLAGGVNLYTQQATVQQNASASFGLLGARNTLFFTAYRLRSEPVAGAQEPVSGPLGTLNNNTQTGAGIAWTHSFTPSLNLNATADWLRTVAIPPQVGKTTQGTLRATLTSPLSINTSVYAGARYQRLRSDISINYSEFAVILGMTHTFR